MKTLSIVVPVYYNEGSLGPLFARLLEIEAKLKAEDTALQLIFVDDGSGDNSFAELMKIKAARPDMTTVVKLTRNFGAMHAGKCGLQYVTGDCFAICAADLQDPPDLLLEMIQHWRGGKKFIIATRESREDPWSTKLFAAIYYWLIRKLVLADYPKGGFDMALMDKALLAPLQTSAKTLYIPLMLFWLGHKPVTIPYHRAKREHGKSRWTFVKKLMAFTDIMLGFSAKPLRLLSALGLIVAVFSFIYGFIVLVGTLLGQGTVPGFAALVCLITFLLGLIITMLGVIGEYIWRISNELNKRPDVVIDEVY